MPGAAKPASLDYWASSRPVRDPVSKAKVDGSRGMIPDAHTHPHSQILIKMPGWGDETSRVVAGPK